MLKNKNKNMVTLKKRVDNLIKENVNKIIDFKKEKEKLPWYKYKAKRQLQSKIDSRKRVVGRLMGINANIDTNDKYEK